MRMRIAFLHPDLGLGGAERLVVDAAAGLAARGHAVSIFTNHFDASRSFAETRDGTFRVRVHGAWLPLLIATLVVEPPTVIARLPLPNVSLVE
jgi:alpha-1,3/alpha-1,6-mannosyltransferase